MSERMRLVGGMKRSRANVIESDDDDFENIPSIKSSFINPEKVISTSQRQPLHIESKFTTKSGIAKQGSSLNTSSISLAGTSASSSSATGTWSCDTCTYCNSNSFSCCEICGTMRILDKRTSWICSSCTLVNENYYRTCNACGKANLIKEPIKQPIEAFIDNLEEQTTTSKTIVNTIRPSFALKDSKQNVNKYHSHLDIDLEYDASEKTLRATKFAEESKSHKVINMTELMDSDDSDDEDDDEVEDDSISVNEEEDFDNEWPDSDDVESFSDEEVVNSTVKSHRSLLHVSKNVKVNSEINIPTIQAAQPSSAFLNPSYSHLSQHFR